MREIMLPVFLLLSLLIASQAQDLNDLRSIQQAIKNIDQAAPNSESDPAQMWKTPQYQALERSSPAIWRMAIENLDQVAPTRNDQAILFQAFEGLPPEEYLEYLSKALDLYSQGKISLGVFTHKILFPDGKMQLFISHNYNQPEVAAFLQKAEDVLKQKGEPLMFNVQEARSGKLKILYDAARSNRPELAKQPIPLLHPSGSLSPTAATTNTNSPPMATAVRPPQTPALQMLPTAEPKSVLRGFPIVPLAIAGALVVGIVLFIVRRKST